MKPNFFFVYLILNALFCMAQSVSAQSHSDSYTTKLDNISARVNASDYGALSEAAALPPEVGIPYLYKWTMFNGYHNPQVYQAAIDALKQIQGGVDYLQQDMAAGIAKGGDAEVDFDVLSMIATPDAQAAIAPYLWNFKLVPPVAFGDTPQIDICGKAMGALAATHPPDNPVKSDEIKNSDALIAWQRWAIAKGFVPREWSSRVGAPGWMLKEEAANNRTTPTQSVPPTRASVTSTPLITHETEHPNNPSNANEPKSAQPTFGWLFFSVLTIVVVGLIGCLILFRRR